MKIYPGKSRYNITVSYFQSVELANKSHHLAQTNKKLTYLKSQDGKVAQLDGVLHPGIGVVDRRAHKTGRRALRIELTEIRSHRHGGCVTRGLRHVRLERWGNRGRRRAGTQGAARILVGGSHGERGSGNVQTTLLSAGQMQVCHPLRKRVSL